MRSQIEESGERLEGIAKLEAGLVTSTAFSFSDPPQMTKLLKGVLHSGGFVFYISLLRGMQNFFIYVSMWSEI